MGVIYKGEGGWEAKLKVGSPCNQATADSSAVCSVGNRDYTNHRIDRDGHSKQFCLVATPQWPHRPCNAPTQFYRVGKKPSVKADLAIYSHVRS